MSGEIVHIEFPSADADRAASFWQGLFGWKFADSGMPGMDYRMAQTSDSSGAAIFASDERPGHPNFYFADSESNAFHLWQQDESAG